MTKAGISSHQSPRCPRCGAERLKSAPGLLGNMIARATERRRYRCGQCSWSGWKRRLVRRSGADTSLLAKSRPSREAYWFIGLAVVVLLVILGMILKSSGPDGSFREPRSIELP